MQIELKRLQNETGITFIFVTHDQEEALTMSDRVAVMNKGKVLQVGSPRDIYDRPAERFVANFIGETNFLEGNVESVANGQASVKLAEGGAVIRAALPAGGAISEGRVSVVIRPEHASLATEAGRGTIRGRLENVVYFGTDTHYHLRLGNGSEFIIRQQNRRSGSDGPAPGVDAGIVIPDDAAQVLRD
jgi:spermidine/putrescine transport system ATP-binding protein